MRREGEVEGRGTERRLERAKWKKRGEKRRYEEGGRGRGEVGGVKKVRRRSVG